MGKIYIGKVRHYYSRSMVAVIELVEWLRTQDHIQFLGEEKGSLTNFEQIVDSMEIHKVRITEAGPGRMVAVQVIEDVRKGDRVYKI